MEHHPVKSPEDCLSDLLWIYNMSYERIADILGVQIDTVRSWHKKHKIPDTKANYLHKLRIQILAEAVKKLPKLLLMSDQAIQKKLFFEEAIAEEWDALSEQETKKLKVKEPAPQPRPKDPSAWEKHMDEQRRQQERSQSQSQSEPNPWVEHQYFLHAWGTPDHAKQLDTPSLVDGDITVEIRFRRIENTYEQNIRYHIAENKKLLLIHLIEFGGSEETMEPILEQVGWPQGT